jgi:two-component system, LuxR family, response regulator FixJ
VQSGAVTPQCRVEGKPLVVTVVDDDPAVCGSLKFSLEIEGFGVRTFGGAAELLSALDFQACDCFVIDQRMTGMTGMELIATLRGLNVQAPMILIVGQPNPAVNARAARAEVAVVEKPLLGNALIDKIRQACATASRTGRPDTTSRT